MTARWHNLIRFTMAAWILMLSLVSSMTFVHTHSSGDGIHHHHQHQSDHATRVHGHCHRLGPCAEESATRDLAPTVSHAHIWLFVADFHFPLPDKDRDSEHPPSDYQLGLPLPKVALNGDAIGDFAVQPDETNSVLATATGNASQRRTGGPAPPKYLCDQARHERSGVLLS